MLKLKHIYFSHLFVNHILYIRSCLLSHLLTYCLLIISFILEVVVFLLVQGRNLFIRTVLYIFFVLDIVCGRCFAS